MKLLTGLREMLYNFTNPVEDINAPTVDVSAEDFIAIAKKNGMSQGEIQECLRNMNGINVTKKTPTGNKINTSQIEMLPEAISLMAQRSEMSQEEFIKYLKNEGITIKKGSKKIDNINQTVLLISPEALRLIIDRSRMNQEEIDKYIVNSEMTLENNRQPNNNGREPGE